MASRREKIDVSKANAFKRSKRSRVAAAAIMSAGVLVPLGVFGGTGFAQSGSPAQAQYKITICHHTHSKKHPTVTISISNRAWPAHQKHGDTLGPCATPKKHAKHEGKAKGKGHSKPKAENQKPSQNKKPSQDQKPSQSQNQNQNPNNGQSKGKGHGK
jgi:hypothetical protein